MEKLEVPCCCVYFLLYESFKLSYNFRSMVLLARSLSIIGDGLKSEQIKDFKVHNQT